MVSGAVALPAVELGLVLELLATVSPSWDGSGMDTKRMMPTKDVARAFYDIYRLSKNTVVEDIVLRPQSGDF